MHGLPEAIQPPDKAGQEAPPSATASQQTLQMALPPQTPQEYRALLSRRNELTSQLKSAQTRRGQAINELTTVPPEARAGLEQRLKMLDEVILKIETDIHATGQQIAAAPAGAVPIVSVEPSPPRQGMHPEQIAAISIVGILFVVFPLTLALTRLLWRRARYPRSTLLQDSEAAQRLRRMEQAVDAVAIEVERISEGQRFLTKLFARDREGATLLHAPDKPEGRATGG